MTIPFLSRVLLAVACLAAMSLPCAAARKARAIFIQPPASPPEKAILFTGAASTEIELPERNFSPEVELPDGDIVVAILASKPAGADAVPAAAQKVKIPQAWTRCLLLFFPDPSNEVFPARVIPVNASTADFPNGHTLIYNVSSAAIMGKFGDQIVRINPGKSGAVKAPVSGEGDYPVAIDCVLQGESKPRAVCRSLWRHNPGARQILFVTPTPGYNIPRVWGILDRQQEEKKN